MIDIGHFYTSQTHMLLSFENHVEITMRCSDEHSATNINIKRLTIEDRGIRHRYYHVDREGRFRQKIMGVQFQAIYTNTPGISMEHEHYIRSRFRPRLK